MVQSLIDLPPELVQKIGSYLTRQEQLMCQNVCQEWQYLFIRQLYKQLCLKFDLDPWWDSLINHGKWVRSITLNMSSIEEKDLARIWHLCPNLVDLQIQSCVSYKIDFSSLKYLSSLYVSSIQIAAIPYSLKKLVLNLEHTDTLICIISSCPRLDTLKLCAGKLSYSTWDQIHQACPQLKSFQLKEVEMEQEEGLNSRVQWPWTTQYMDELEMESVLGWENALVFASDHYEYLKRLVVSLPETEMGSGKGLNRLATRCPLIQELHLTHVSLPSNFFGMLDKAGSRLDQLTMGDASDRTLGYLESLAASYQRPRRLKIWGWASLVFSSRLDRMFSLVSQCQPSAFEFSMEHAGVLYSRVHLAKFLQTCYGLRSLTLSYVQLAETSEAIQAPSLQGLSLCHSLVHPDWMDLLGPRFPQLTELELDQCSLMTCTPSDLKIHLPHHTLRSLVLNQIQPVYNDRHQAQIQPILLFCIQSKQRSQWIDHQGTPLPKPTSLPSIFVKCASIHELILAGLCVSA